MSLFLYFVFLRVLVTLSEGNASTELFNLFASNSRLDNSVVESLSNLSVISCAIACAQHQSLIAFNYNKVNGKCELIEADPSAKLIADHDYSYYTKPLKPDPCQSQPCSYGRNCSSKSNGLDYQCSECPYPLNGDNCEGFIEPLCVKSNDTAYCALDIPSDNWNNSYAKCIEKGMRLAMLKDRDSHKFIKHTLSNTSASSTIYWIGLRRMTHEGEWAWLDGTTLGQYQPWGSNPDDFWPGLSCAQVNGDVGGYNFVPDECGVLTKNVRYIPLCEIKLIP